MNRVPGPALIVAQVRQMMMRIALNCSHYDLWPSMAFANIQLGWPLAT